MKASLRLLSYYHFLKLKNSLNLNKVGRGVSLPPTYSLSEGHVLVGAEESHELGRSVDSDGTGLVDIEMSPGLVPVGVEVSLSVGTGESLMGSEDLDSGSSGNSLWHEEGTVWTSSVFLILGSLNGILVEHGSHEDVDLWVVLSWLVKSSWDDSLVSGTGSWSEVSNLEVFVLGGGGRRGGGGHLDVGSHWWSGVGSKGRDITVLLLEDSLVSVLEDGSELPGLGSILGGDDADEGEKAEVFHF